MSFKRLDVLEKVKTRVLETLKVSENIDENEDLTLKGLDSIKTVELIVDLEEAFEIAFQDEEMLTENFISISKITDRILTKL